MIYCTCIMGVWKDLLHVHHSCRGVWKDWTAHAYHLITWSILRLSKNLTTHFY